MSYSRPFISVIVTAVAFLVFRNLSGPTIVKVETGTTIYHGIQSKSAKLATFYGVPYAEPPLGNRRFRAPVPLKYGPNEGGKKPVINTQEKPSFCVQGSIDPANLLGGAGSEDCLYVNIYTPKSALVPDAGEKLPVLVYIHGGGFVFGNPLSWPFEHWVEHFPNTVVVSIYYRLSIFGFLSAPSGTKSAGFDANAGFLDQIEALKWVKQNIGSFGGDNNRITIDGQSAGGASVLLHLLANGGRQQLFQQAIAQSIYRPGLMRIAETKERFDFIAQHAQCNASGFSEAEKVDCLRTKDVATLIGAAEAAQRHDPTWRHIPVVDGVLFEDTPTVLLNKRRISPVPVLTGATTDESFTRSDNYEAEMKNWYSGITKKEANALSRIYPEADFRSRHDAVAAALGETLLRCGSETLVELITKLGKTAYLYRFDEPNPTQNGSLVQHSAENWWMFQGSNTGNNGSFTLTPLSPSQERFSKELIAYWLSFVHTGNPNSLRLSDTPEWPAWIPGKGLANRQRAVFKQRDGSIGGSGSYVETKAPKELDRCLAVNRMAGKIRF